MKPGNNVDSADAVLKLKNTIWAFPYLAVMGLIWGYLAGASSGAIAGLAVAAALSVLLGSATSIFTGTPGADADNSRCDPRKSTMGVQKQLVTDLKVVVYHKLCHGGNMDNKKLGKKEAATILAKAWNNLDASLIEPYIAEDIIYWSQQVLTDMTGKKAVMNYLTDKMETIRKSPDEQVFAELGETKPYPMAPNPSEPCVILAQGHKDNVNALALLRIESNKINSIGICFDAPHPSTAKRSGEYPA